MTMTKTKAQADPLAELAAIEEQLQVAREERSRLGQEARTWADGVAGLEAELDGLAGSDAGQFANGQPKPKTRAAELRAEIAKRLDGQKWPQILEGSDQRIRSLEAELERATGANAEELARREYEQGKAAAEKIRRGAALILEGYAEYVASEHRLISICKATPGLDGQDVVSDPRAAQLVRQVEGLEDLAPPRSQSLTPLASEGDPPRFRIRSGGFVSSPNPDDVEGVEQPKSGGLMNDKLAWKRSLLRSLHESGTSERMPVVLPPIVPSNGPRPGPMREHVGGGWYSTEIPAQWLWGDLGKADG